MGYKIAVLEKDGVEYALPVEEDFKVVVSDTFNNFVTKTTTYTATFDDNIILCDCSSNDVPITLPAPTTKGLITVKKIDTTTNTVDVDCVGYSIDSYTDVQITKQNTSLSFQSDGTEWWII